MNSTFTKILSFILAAVLITHGLNEFFHFNFMPVLSVPEEALNFQNSLSATGYLLPVLGVVEVFIAILLLMRKWVPFALIILAPISINVLLFHVFLNISGIWIALITVSINILLIYKYWKAYRPLFQ